MHSTEEDDGCVVYTRTNGINGPRDEDHSLEFDTNFYNGNFQFTELEKARTDFEDCRSQMKKTR